jgi:hypothetical protein
VTLPTPAVFTTTLISHVNFANGLVTHLERTPESRRRWQSTQYRYECVLGSRRPTSSDLTLSRLSRSIASESGPVRVLGACSTEPALRGTGKWWRFPQVLGH